MTVRLLLSAGRGPQECAWALAHLLRRLEADAVRQRLRVQRIDTVAGDRPGTYRSVLVEVGGAGVEAFAVSWTGTLCWQAPSPYRAGVGRKNWYVTARCGCCGSDSRTATRRRHAMPPPRGGSCTTGWSAVTRSGSNARSHPTPPQAASTRAGSTRAAGPRRLMSDTWSSGVGSGLTWITVAPERAATCGISAAG